MDANTSQIGIIGYTGSGKTTTGAAVAAALGGRYVDCSDVIAACVGELADSERVEKKRLGQWLCEIHRDEAYLVHEAQRQGATIVGGMRRCVELACARPGLDAVAWIRREVPMGETDELMPWDGDFVIDNRPNWGDGIAWESYVDDAVATITQWLARPVAYLARPYRAWLDDGEWDRDAMALRRAQEVADGDRVIAAGGRPFCPLNAFRALDDIWSPPEILALCVQRLETLLPESTSIYFAPGWGDSEGCRVEHDLAKELEMNICYNMDQLAESIGCCIS